MTPGERGDGGGVDAAGQERTHGDVGAHVLGHGVLEGHGDLLVAALGIAVGDRDHGEGRLEVALDHRSGAGGEGRVATGFQAADTAGQRLVLGDVLEGDVVL